MQPPTMFAGLFQAVPGLNLLAKNTASLRFNSDWEHRGSMRTSSTWDDAKPGQKPAAPPQIKTQTCPIFREGGAQGWFRPRGHGGLNSVWARSAISQHTFVSVA